MKRQLDKEEGKRLGKASSNIPLPVIKEVSSKKIKTNPDKPTNNFKKRCSWFNENWKDVVPIFLTIALVYQGFSSFQLSKKITEREVEILRGKQLLILDETNDFLFHYIDNFLRYLAYEHSKVLTTHFNVISSGNPTEPTPAIQEEPIVSRRYYVDISSLRECYECSLFIGFLPDEQNKIDSYFGANPVPNNLEKGTLNQEQTLKYLKLKRLIEQFNKDFNRFAIMNKQAEELEVKILLKHKSEAVDWTRILLNEKKALVQSIKVIKQQGDMLLKSFPELNVEPLKFEINVTGPFKRYGAINTEKEPLESYINPVKEATISLDDKNYRFDYYIYFTKSIEDKIVAARGGKAD